MRVGRMPVRRLLYTAIAWAGTVAAPATMAQAPQDFVPVPGTCVPMADPTGKHIKNVLPQLNPIYYQASSHPEPSSLPPGTILRAPAPTFLYRNLCAVDFAFSDGSLTRVPALTGMTGEAALQTLAAADLVISINEVRSGEPTGLVFNQRPDPEQEVARRSTVEVTIALPLLYDVPDVIGLALREALPGLTRFSVTRNVITSARPAGEVTDQDPRAPAQLPARAQVRVDVSDGSLVAVPAVERQSLEEAQAELSQAGLQAAVEEREGDLVPGVVATQDPTVGNEVPRGSTVRLVVSTGLSVPDVIGQPIDEARQLLARFVVEPTTVARPERTGEVVEQEPRSPARVAAGAVVRVHVSDGSRVQVPPVVGRPSAEAQATLQGAGLGAAVLEREDDRAPGVVAQQNPPADSEVARGSVVQLGVSTGIAVPLVVGQSIAQASKALARFTVEQRTVASDKPRDEVVDQNPKPPARVAANSTVVVNVSDASPEVPSPHEKSGDDDAAPPIPLWVLTLGALVAGGVLGRALYRWIRRPVVSAKVESGAVDVRMLDAGLVGPEIRFSARVERGETQVRFEGESP